MDSIQNILQDQPNSVDQEQNVSELDQNTMMPTEECKKNAEEYRQNNTDEHLHISDEEDSSESEQHSEDPDENISVSEYSEDSDEVEYIVEKILDKRIREDVTEYFIKWKNFSEGCNTWEPETNMNCQELIREYELKIQEIECRVDQQKSSVQLKKNIKSLQGKIIIRTYKGISGFKYKVSDGVLGFRRGLSPKKILEASQHKGQVVFLMKWWESAICDFVYDWEAKERCPRIVLDYYDKFVKWLD